jgi:predicted lipoprotein with Yx(FWY)xxD motif
MNRLLIVILAVAGVCLAACGSSSKPSAQSSTSPTNAATTTTGGYSSAGRYGAASSTTTAGTSSVVLQTAMNATVHQTIVVDGAKHAVYIYVPDGSSTSSKVPAALKAVWPAVTSTSSTPAVGAGITASKVTVNSAHQVAYNGHLLYTFTPDTTAGVAKGQGLGKIWYVIAPSGTPIT